MRFAEYNKFNLSDINKEVLARWREQDLFRQSMKEREGSPSFVFYEGPPSANGMPGIHHDKRYRVPLQDHEGLPCKA